jgi:conjugal transfer pilus assembly protein TraA
MFKRINKPAVAASAVLALGTGAAMAGTTGNEFAAMYNLILGWAEGYLGKAMAIAAFLFGAGFGVAKQTILPAVLGVVFALVFAVGPGIINGMLAATI